MKAWMKTPRTQTVTLAAVLAGVLVASPARAQTGTPPPDNVIVIFADDLGWNDLPFFSPPVNQAGYEANFPQADKLSKGERALIRPAVNRFSARMYARREATTTPPIPQGALGTFTEKLHSGAELSYEVRPIDQALSGAAPGYFTGGKNGNCGSTAPHKVCSACDPADPACDIANCCKASTDVLEGFGGLKRLQDEGVTFPRFYANTSKCAPSRASLFTGRYPNRTGVNNNGNELGTDEVTIAEFLKQGCTDPADLPSQCFDGKSLSPCTCYLTNQNECTAANTRGACYHTGLIGKWHLGDMRPRSKTSPWMQGFDESFSFGGGARSYWKTKDLHCSPAPNHCDITLSVCISNADCDPNDTCGERALYLGTQQGFNPCSSDDNQSGVCCDLLDRPGIYSVEHRLVDGGVASANGRDSRSNTENWPCSDTGLTTHTHCAYLTRVLRDQARNFIVRNSDRQPYFLALTYHAVHRAYLSPIRTEDHYLTGTDPSNPRRLRPGAPNAASKYWGSIEEMDSSIGQLLAVLDSKGVCQDDPSISCQNENDSNCGICVPATEKCQNDPSRTCMSDSDCVGICIGIGRCTGVTVPARSCLTNSNCGGDTCEPQSKHTYVFFTSDQGRPHAKSAYGQPDLRGGKGDLFEGGVRVGLLVRGPSSLPHQCVKATSGLPGINCNANDPNACACDPSDPSTCPNTDETCQSLVQSQEMGSMVDVFATAADIAGYDTTAPLMVLPKGTAGKCSMTTTTQCTVNADCPTGETCSTNVVIDGKSLLSVIGDPRDTPGVIRARDFSFAKYPGAGTTVISREGYFDNGDSTTAGKVCAYDSRVDAPNAIREIHGASCDTCASDVECVGDSQQNIPTKMCKVAGKVCVADADVNINQCVQLPMGGGPQPPVDPAEKDACIGFSLNLGFSLAVCTNNTDCVSPETCGTDGICSTPCTSDSDCTAQNETCGPNGVCWIEEQHSHALYRCERDSDCPPGTNLKCRKNVWAPCNTCVAATWKLKGAPDGTPKRLFDLTSNPEEEERLNFYTCKNSASTVRPADVQSVGDTLEGDPTNPSNASQGLLKGWLTCMSNQCSTPY